MVRIERQDPHTQAGLRRGTLTGALVETKAEMLQAESHPGAINWGQLWEAGLSPLPTRQVCLGVL